MTEVPPQVVIDALRNEIARLNDERDHHQPAVRQSNHRGPATGAE